jgi:Ulp1 family protease
LSDEELRTYQNANKEITILAKSGGQRKVMSTKRFGIETMEVNNFDLDRLDPDRPGTKWLNDEVINFYLALVAERENAGGKTRVLVHNTYFWTNLTKPRYNYGKVSRWSRRRGAAGSKILDLDCMIIPINQGNSHWTLAVINFKKKRFEYYDSLGGSSDTRRLYITVSPLVFA